VDVGSVIRHSDGLKELLDEAALVGVNQIPFEVLDDKA
jgi:hypothetical protein